MKIKVLLFILSILLFAFTFDDEWIKQLSLKFSRYQNSFPQEKAYLHLDKPYYTAGETIWFKAYLVEANTLTPDTVSIPLYVELIDNQKGKLIDKKILKLENGSAAADFLLPDSIQAGYYRLRAYTNWMLNFDENLIFTKDFKVFRPSQEENTTKLNPQEIDFRFFPEGGHLIEGMESRLAYKAVDALGNGLDITGVILDQNSDTITSFESEHLGMGFVNFKPETGSTYTAKVHYRNIYEKTVELPLPEKEGIMLGIESVVDKENIRVFISHNFSNPTNLVIVGQARGEILYLAKPTPDKRKVMLKISKNKFPEGITQFTVLNDKGQPLCERVIYIKHDNQLNINLVSNKTKYNKREKVTLDIETTDTKGQPISADLSVSVTDAGQVLEAPYAENIWTYLLLDSDIKGRIEQPAYYFDNSNINANRHLDILMMTQGWRRYRWNDILKDEFPQPKFNLERGISLSGEISRLNGKVFEKPVNLTFMFSLKDSTKLFGMGLAGKEGNFMIENLNFVDSAQVIIQAIAGNNNRNTKIFINKNYAPKIQVVAIPFNSVTFDVKELADYLRRTKEALDFERSLRFNKAILLNEVKIKAKRNVQDRDSRVLYNQANKSLKVDQTMIGYNNVLDLLRGRIAGVQVSGSANDPVVTIRGASSFTGSSEPLFLIDGIRTEKSTILMIPVTDVDRVDVLTGAESAIYGMGAGNGVISVLTKRGNPNYDYSNDKAAGIEAISIAGYYPTKEFYAPKYDEILPEHARPDFRSTIYWAPKIRTNANGKAQISYFNSDATSKVNVLLQGISTSGIPIVAKHTYELGN
ncbi:TonB-dependent receptor plug [Emticicia oligotrophica DSM 17448]|uniref:TonB-dependent receptor plug n=1 Tax=Emticicia oligotrophica (strain DSM 17448 / CIP 109782 / MTCC 6937 / GPTSA100-15) TaxID=929562 RepID=A0ABN4ACX3_EMTOG|nr:TonB-dependent receptor plug domain-containing protein [Emticicia oligotrophica]AFK02145.1 TonB-dependent receptor plug [Emticicia oligotrophica DSM 17448]